MFYFFVLEFDNKGGINQIYVSECDAELNRQNVLSFAPTISEKEMFSSVIAAMAEERVMLFPTVWQMRCFHEKKRKFRLHTHAGKNYVLENFLSVNITDVHPMELLNEMEAAARQFGIENVEEKTCNLITQRTLAGILSCDSYWFIGDNSTKIYHRKDCNTINSIPLQSISGLGKNPEKKGFQPCTCCKPDILLAASISPAKAKKVSHGIQASKSETMKTAIASTCKKYNMHVEFAGGIAYITTIAGEWYFAYNDRPIRLKHKNCEIRTDQYGNSKGYYHQQYQEFYAPLQVLAYIYNHEKAVERRLFSAETTDETIL